MITTRKAADRGHFDFGWLDTRHTFSFGEYSDPRHMGFGPLRVINEDRVKAGEGFGTHGHRDMEILTWVLSGALEHKDSLGSVGVLRPGTAQRMSAGTGIRHSEYNHSSAEEVHFLQIWIVPAVRGAEPRYEDREFPEAGRRDRLQLLASPDAADGSLSLHQDVRVFVADLGEGKEIPYALAPGRKAWVQVARGSVSLRPLDGSGGAGSGADTALAAGDGASLADGKGLVLKAESPAEILLFDLP